MVLEGNITPHGGSVCLGDKEPRIEQRMGMFCFGFFVCLFLFLQHKQVWTQYFLHRRKTI